MGFVGDVYPQWFTALEEQMLREMGRQLERDLLSCADVFGEFAAALRSQRIPQLNRRYWLRMISNPIASRRGVGECLRRHNQLFPAESHNRRQAHLTRRLQRGRAGIRCIRLPGRTE